MLLTELHAQLCEFAWHVVLLLFFLNSSVDVHTCGKDM